MTKIVGMQLYIDLSLNNKAMALERLTFITDNGITHSTRYNNQ